MEEDLQLGHICLPQDPISTDVQSCHDKSSVHGKDKTEVSPFSSTDESSPEISPHSSPLLSPSHMYSQDHPQVLTPIQSPQSQEEFQEVVGAEEVQDLPQVLTPIQSPQSQEEFQEVVETEKAQDLPQIQIPLQTQQLQEPSQEEAAGEAQDIPQIQIQMQSQQLPEQSQEVVGAEKAQDLPQIQTQLQSQELQEQYLEVVGAGEVPGENTSQKRKGEDDGNDSIGPQPNAKRRPGSDVPLDRSNQTYLNDTNYYENSTNQSMFSSFSTHPTSNQPPSSSSTSSSSPTAATFQQVLASISQTQPAVYEALHIFMTQLENRCAELTSCLQQTSQDLLLQHQRFHQQNAYIQELVRGQQSVTNSFLQLFKPSGSLIGTVPGSVGNQDFNLLMSNTFNQNSSIPFTNSSSSTPMNDEGQSGYSSSLSCSSPPLSSMQHPKVGGTGPMSQMPPIGNTSYQQQQNFAANAKREKIVTVPPTAPFQVTHFSLAKTSTKPKTKGTKPSQTPPISASQKSQQKHFKIIKFHSSDHIVQHQVSANQTLPVSAPSPSGSTLGSPSQITLGSTHGGLPNNDLQSLPLSPANGLNPGSLTENNTQNPNNGNEFNSFPRPTNSSVWSSLAAAAAGTPTFIKSFLQPGPYSPQNPRPQQKSPDGRDYTLQLPSQAQAVPTLPMIETTNGSDLLPPLSVASLIALNLPPPQTTDAAMKKD